jgi:hypothetical protein
MTTRTPLRPHEFVTTLSQELASDLSLTTEQLQALEELEVNHHRRAKEPIVRQMTGTILVTNGYYHYETPTIPIAWRHLHRVGKIIAPDDGSVWSIQIRDALADKIIYSGQNLRANETIVMDYSPGFTMRAVVDLRCISDANKTVEVEFDGEVRLG